VRLVVILASVGALYSTAGLTSPALWGIGAPVSQEATNRSFDELARGLANGSISRRKAIKFIAATTLGGILGLSGIGTAFAKNKTCAQWCAAVFGANTPAAGRCTSDAAHGTGLCSSCTTATLPSSVCCTRNSSGNCISYSGASCPCDSSQCLTCDSSTGTCVGTCTSGQTCQAGTCCTSNGGTCTSANDCCSGNCSSSSGTCAPLCPAPPACTDACPCPSGQTCLNGSCCPNDQVCGSTCGCPTGQTCQNGTCVPTTSILLCFCNDETNTGGLCLHQGCSGDEINAACGSACADHGGFSGESSCLPNHFC
jgi:hypothetical protein